MFFTFMIIINDREHGKGQVGGNQYRQDWNEAGDSCLSQKHTLPGNRYCLEVDEKGEGSG
jgi:hypothetical protein